MTSIPTRPTWAPWRILLRWYYQIRIASAEDDIHALKHQPVHIAAQIRLHEACVEHWRVRLANTQD